MFYNISGGCTSSDSLNITRWYNHFAINRQTIGRFGKNLANIKTLATARNLAVIVRSKIAIARNSKDSIITATS
jgi:hypothetical protein